MSGLFTTVRCVCNEIWKTMRGDGGHSGHHESCFHHRRRANSMESRRKSRPSRQHRSAERTPTTASSLTHENNTAPSRHGKQHSCKASSRSSHNHQSTSSSHNHHAHRGPHQSAHRRSKHDAVRDTYQPCPQSPETDLYKGRLPGETERHYETPDHIYDTPENVVCAVEPRRDLVPVNEHRHSRVAARRSVPGASGGTSRGKHNLQSDIGTLCHDIEQQLSALEKSLESEFQFYKQYIKDTKSLLTTRAANIGNKALLYEDYNDNHEDDD
ncbi:NF-kappaB inhibitor [Bovine papular stomatitis virus]|uniref:NF-kappaB inhibitor n=1 Tax=Bovine papular stomatitis virus TaxID=129727 RepID=A0A0E3T6M4_9POXV|nr:NF-kappaB inhibitor [Bovine papular stomatitis virus]AKC03417.1 NF-kappaB inhibitor [Bovine papular stomatitis virus]